MRTFQVTVHWERPYPVTTGFREQGGRIEVAIARALRRFRKEEMKGRPIKRIKVEAYLIPQTHAERT